MEASNDLALSPAVRLTHDGRSRSAGDSSFSRRTLALLFLGALTEMALLALWQRDGYWDFSVLDLVEHDQAARARALVELAREVEQPQQNRLDVRVRVSLKRGAESRAAEQTV